MSDTPTPFHRLPDELVVHVFKLAAASSPETCLTLTLVAGWTRHIVSPYLLHTVVIRSEAAASAFICLLDEHPQYAALVENASVTFPGNDCGLLCFQIVQRCPNLTNIAMLGTSFESFARWRATDAGPALLPSRELHLTVPPSANVLSSIVYGLLNAMRHARNNVQSIPVLKNITRLDTALLPRWFGRARPFDALAHLTHLRVRFPLDDRRSYEAVMRTPEKHANIQVLVLSVDGARYRDDVVFSEWFWDARDRMDGRLYVTSAHNTPEEWERVARDRGDIWEDAISETEDWRRAVSGPCLH
ncbi:hypothetical protein PLICRDRAFT_177316 [Plicaturopsis crispa FD-325 SS-3]|nr:hypothetical protein PLICRDRAFT_177316 [Plicaturopsis crispa FD-325 SS-3]